MLVAPTFDDFAAVMEGAVDLFELGVGEVGVDLSGGDGRMAEHGLDGTDIGTVNQ